MSRVLVGFAEALAAPEAIFSLRTAGHEVRLFAREGARAPALSLGAGAPLRISDPARDAAGAIAALRRAVEADPKIAAILPLDDASLWLTDRAFRPGAAPLGGRNLPAMAGATGPQAALALDKRAQVRAAEAAGFLLPLTRVIEGPEGLEVALGDLPLPAIVKPALAAAPVGAGLARGGAVYLEDRAAAARLAAGPGDRPGLFPALAQPLVRGVGEGVFGFATPEGVRAWSGHRRLRMMNPHGSGASACRAVAPRAEDRAAAERLVMDAGWRGPFMVELLRGEDGRARFMELNGRLWGSLALARRGGMEYPAWAVAGALDPTFRPPDLPPPEGIEVRHLGREILHVLHVLRGPRSGFHREGWPRLLPTLAAVLRPGPARGLYNHDASAPRFWLREAAATVREAFR